jgi:aspergillopepsin I
VRATAYTVGNGRRIPLQAQAIVDTGSTLLMLPNQTARDYYDAVPGSKYVSGVGYVHPCGATLPDLTLEAASPPTPAAPAGTATLALPGRLLTRGGMQGGSTCFGGVQMTSKVDMVIWGDVLLKALFVVFDGRDAPRVGFALQAETSGVDAAGIAVPGGGGS